MAEGTVFIFPLPHFFPSAANGSYEVMFRWTPLLERFNDTHTHTRTHTHVHSLERYSVSLSLINSFLRHDQLDPCDIMFRIQVLRTNLKRNKTSRIAAASPPLSQPLPFSFLGLRGCKLLNTPTNTSLLLRVC